MKKFGKGLVIGCLVLAALTVGGKYLLFPRYEEIKTTGVYEINCEDYWVTTAEPDPFLTDGRLREVQVRAWYPIDKEDPQQLPVVIASHGSCGSIDNNRSLYREFASHGYVVLAVGHPGHAMDTRHSDGKKQSVSMTYLQEVASVDPQNKPEEAAALFAKWMKLRMSDLAAVMDDFAHRAAQSPGRFGAGDPDRFVVVGHSAGGSAALGMARTRTDVVGVIALESPFMYDIQGVRDGEYIMDTTVYKVPILNVYSDASYSHLSEWKQYGNNARFLKNENGNCENIYYEGIGHMGLCDLSLASPILASLLDQRKSEIEPGEQLSRLNADCLDFVQRVLEH